MGKPPIVCPALSPLRELSDFRLVSVPLCARLSLSRDSGGRRALACNMSRARYVLPALDPCA